MDIVGDTRGASMYNLLDDIKEGIIGGTVKSARRLLANKEKAARANTIKNIIGISKDAKISGLNKILMEVKFSKNDTAMIKKIAEKISQNKPLTETQTKNLITIKNLIEKKLPQSEVKKFRQVLPNKDVGKGLTSINKKEPVMAMSGDAGNASKKFNSQLQKLINGQLKKNEIMGLGNPSEILTNAGIRNAPIQIESSHLLKKSQQTNHPFSLKDLKDLPKAVNDSIGIFKSHTKKGSYVILTDLKDTSTEQNFVVALRFRDLGKNLKINEIQSIHPRKLQKLKQTAIYKTQIYINQEKMKK